VTKIILLTNLGSLFRGFELKICTENFERIYLLLWAPNCGSPTACRLAKGFEVRLYWKTDSICD